MNTKIIALIIISFMAFGFSYCQVKPTNNTHAASEYEIIKSESEWKSILSPEEFSILREKNTEYAFTGEYNSFKGKGTYFCAGCNSELFTSDTKYESGCGWPSFYEPSTNKAIKEIPDNTLGMVRTEIVCAKCGGHLGHVFNDGPKPTGLRYCVNSASLDFRPKE